MQIDIITLFPNMFKGPFDESIINRAKENKIVEINIHNLRDWTKDKHKMVDDKPYGGGPGMILKVDVIDTALKDLKNMNKSKRQKIILLTPKGKKYTQQVAQEYSTYDHLILIAGRYEGFDHRIHEHLIDEEVSIGDYVLTGGELPAMVLVDSVVRLIPGVLGKDESTKEESHSKPGYIEYPQYTRPEKYGSWKVPEILLSGDHKKIEEWKKKQSRG